MEWGMKVMAFLEHTSCASTKLVPAGALSVGDVNLHIGGRGYIMLLFWNIAERHEFHVSKQEECP
jgi:hypothetical protein